MKIFGVPLPALCGTLLVVAPRKRATASGDFSDSG